MLASLLPGLRELRTPLATGYLWLLAMWLWFGGDRLIPEQGQNIFTSRVLDITTLVGATITLAGISFVAYMLGSLLRARKLPRSREVSLRALGHALRARLARRRRRHLVPPATPLEIWTDRLVSDWVDAGMTVEVLKSEPSISREFVRRAETTMKSSVFADLPSDFTEMERHSLRDGLAIRSALTDAISAERNVLRLRLQIERPSLYNEYDRKIREAELRFSIIPPTLVIVAVAAVLWTPLSLLLLIAPIGWAVEGMALVSQADQTVTEALTSGVIESPTIAALGSIETTNW